MQHRFTHAAGINLSQLRTTDDGAVIMNAVPMRVGDMEHLGFELPSALFQELGVEFEDIVIGRYERDTTENMASQMKACAITRGHVFLEAGDRKEFAIGTLLEDGQMDGDLVRTEAEINNPEAIVAINSGTCELSTGGFGDYVANPNRGRAGEPDFFIRNVTLNHVALVEEGRAGPEARLLNHRKEKKESPMFKLGTREFANEAAAAEKFAELENAAAKVPELTTKVTDLESEVETLTNSRDELEGKLTVAEASIENANPQADAVKLANTHAAFVENANKLGYEGEDLKLGEYEMKDEKRKLLNSLGLSMADDASDVQIDAAFDAALKLNKPKEPTQKSVFDTPTQNSKRAVPLSEEIRNSKTSIAAKKGEE